MIPKFRACDINSKEIVDVARIEFDSETIFIANNNKSINDYQTLGFWQGFKSFILMQSTGLYDRHGVEIFQGDIVKIVYDGEPFTGVVVYDLGEADFKATNGHEDYGNNFQYLTVGESIEVIGNVHQHVELLG